MTWPWPPPNMAQKGWQCPVCSHVYAPWVVECIRCKEVAITQKHQYRANAHTDQVGAA